MGRASLEGEQQSERHEKQKEEEEEEEEEVEIKPSSSLSFWVRCLDTGVQSLEQGICCMVENCRNTSGNAGNRHKRELSIRTCVSLHTKKEK